MKLSALIAQKSADKVPAGWKTIDQLAREEQTYLGGTFRSTVREAVRIGVLERKDFRIFTAGQRHLTPHYRRVK